MTPTVAEFALIAINLKNQFWLSQLDDSMSNSDFSTLPKEEAELDVQLDASEEEQMDRGEPMPRYGPAEFEVQALDQWLMSLE